MFKATDKSSSQTQPVAAWTSCEHTGASPVRKRYSLWREQNKMVARGTRDQDWRDFPLKMMEGTASYKLHGKGTQQAPTVRAGVWERPAEDRSTGQVRKLHCLKTSACFLH